MPMSQQHLFQLANTISAKYFRRNFHSSHRRQQDIRQNLNKIFVTFFHLCLNIGIMTHNDNIALCYKHGNSWKWLYQGWKKFKSCLLLPLNSWPILFKMGLKVDFQFQEVTEYYLILLHLHTVNLNLNCSLLSNTSLKRNSQSCCVFKSFSCLFYYSLCCL